MQRARSDDDEEEDAAVLPSTRLYLLCVSCASAMKCLWTPGGREHSIRVDKPVLLCRHCVPNNAVELWHSDHLPAQPWTSKYQCRRVVYCARARN